MKFWNFSNFTLWNSEFQLWTKIPLKLVIFPLWTKGFRFKKVFSNLEPEGQGCGIIKGVTRLLLLGPDQILCTFLHTTVHYPAQNNCSPLFNINQKPSALLLLINHFVISEENFSFVSSLWDEECKDRGKIDFTRLHLILAHPAYLQI